MDLHTLYAKEHIVRFNYIFKQDFIKNKMLCFCCFISLRMKLELKLTRKRGRHKKDKLWINNFAYKIKNKQYAKRSKFLFMIFF